MAWKNPDEVATLTVNGTPYRDWTAVTVTDDLESTPPTFAFECTEFSPLPVSFSSMQIAPGDECTISLGGAPMMTGYVKERHVGYAGKEHSILITGASRVDNLVRTSILPTTNGVYDNMTLEQIARKAAGNHGVNVKTIGNIPTDIFKEVEHNPGEITFSFIEKLCRMRNVVLAGDPQGNLLLIGEHDGTTVGQLIEGKNILRASCLITDQNIMQRYSTSGAQAGHDDLYGDKANKGVREAQGKSAKPIFFHTFAETATSSDTELQYRVDNLKRVFEYSEIVAAITVQGWLKAKGGDPWRIREMYYVKSPMLILDQTLSCKKVVYDQRDGAGTTTTLTMVNNEYLRKHAPLSNPTSTPVVKPTQPSPVTGRAPGPV
jgi:prophage tail gpP-like protein